MIKPFYHPKVHHEVVKTTLGVLPHYIHRFVYRGLNKKFIKRSMPFHHCCPHLTDFEKLLAWRTTKQWRECFNEHYKETLNDGYV